jgi:hypothetical protein
MWPVRGLRGRKGGAICNPASEHCHIELIWVLFRSNLDALTQNCPMLQVRYMIDPATPTGTCAVCVAEGDRSLVAYLAAANNYKVGLASSVFF